MLLMTTPRMRGLVSVLAPLLLLTSCDGGNREALSAGSRPPVERVTPIATPTIPAPSAPCPWDPTKLCNSDAETGSVIAGYDDALATANRSICWMRVWFGYPACAANPPPR